MVTTAIRFRRGAASDAPHVPAANAPLMAPKKVRRFIVGTFTLFTTVVVNCKKQAVNPFPGLSPNPVLCTTAGLPMQHFFCVLRLPPTVFVFRNRIKDVKF